MKKEPKQKREVCHICGQYVTQSEAFGYDPVKGYYHSECFYEERLKMR